MSSSNPTPLNVGTTGGLVGKRFTVAGRVVMSAEFEGEACHWNEFHLVDDAGQSAILVHEEEGDGTPWKLFTYVEPVNPLNATGAAAQRVGHAVNLDGTEARVTLVGQSRVTFIEGRPPEGVEVGDVANFFNAMTGNRMLVVSWTGDEVEVFRGIDLPSHAVTSAFGLPAMPQRIMPGFLANGSGEKRRTFGSWLVPLLFFLAIPGIILGRMTSCRSDPRQAAAVPVKPSTPPSPLVLGMSITLDGNDYRIRGHAVMEVAQVGAKFDRHDYHLINNAGSPVLLVLGFDGRTNQWHLLTPVEPPASFTPQAAAALRLGYPISINGETNKVNNLFLITSLSAEGEGTPARSNVFYCLTARRSGGGFLMASWNEGTLNAWHGNVLSDQVTQDILPLAVP
jgi:Domain of unknown function (DUF4178)